MFKLALGLALCLGLSGNVLASCERPTAPEIPDPNSAVTAQMVKAQNDVKAFISSAEKYLNCDIEDTTHDAVVEEMRQVADNFNESIRAYKARMGNS